MNEMNIFLKVLENWFLLIHGLALIFIDGLGSVWFDLDRQVG